MSALLSSAPQLEMQRIDQIAALPLGGTSQAGSLEQPSGDDEDQACGSAFAPGEDAVRSYTVLSLSDPAQHAPVETASAQ